MIMDEVRSLETNEADDNIRLLLEILLEQIVWVDPSVALDQVWSLKPHTRASSLNTVFTEWSLIDIDGAIAAAMELETTWKLSSLQSIFQSRSDLPYSELKELATKWNVVEVLNTVTIKNTIAEMMDRPKDAIDFLLNSNIPRHHKAKFSTAIVSHWIQRRGLDEQALMFSVCQELLTQDQLLFSELVPLVAALNPNRAWNTY